MVLLIRQFFGRSWTDIPMMETGGEKRGMYADFMQTIIGKVFQKLIDGINLEGTKNFCRSLYYNGKRRMIKIFRLKKKNISNLHVEMAPAVPDFTGREELLDKLENIILKENVSLIVLYGLGGMGKTTVASYLAKKLKDSFEHVIWQPLQDINNSDAKKIFADFIRFFSYGFDKEIFDDADRQMETLLKYLSAQRCFLIFDNAETVLSEEYPEEGKALYERLLMSVMDRRTISCVLITSREKPAFLLSKAGSRSCVRCINLPGLEVPAVKEYVKEKELKGSDEEWDGLVGAYSGNPLLLNLSADIIQENYGGKIADFLKKGSYMTQENVVSKSIDILSEEEKTVIKWFSLKSPRKQEEIEGIFTGAADQKTAKILQRLQQKAMLRQTDEGLISHNIIVEYMQGEMVRQIRTAIMKKEWRDIRDFAVLEADAPDYVKENQVKKIVIPVLFGLYSELCSWNHVAAHLEEVLAGMKNVPMQEQRYAPGNVVNLLLYCAKEESRFCGKEEKKYMLAGRDLSGYVIRKADLDDQMLYKTDFTGSHFEGTKFHENIDLPVSCAFSHSGGLFAVGDIKGNLIFWDGSTFEKKKTVNLHSRTIYGIAFTEDDRYLVTVSYDGTIRCLAAGTYAEIGFFDGFRVSCGLNCLDVRGNLAVAAGNDKKIYLWRDREKTPEVFSDPAWGTFHAVKIAADGSFLIAGDSEGNVCKISTAPGILPITVKAHEGQVSAMAVHGADGQFVTGGKDGRILLWKPAMKFQTLTDDIAHTGFVTGLAFTEDDTLISAGHDKKIKLWKKQKRPENFITVSTLYDPAGRIEGIAFSKDDKTLISCSNDMSLNIWDLKKGVCLKKVTSYCRWVSSLLFYHKGRYLAGGCADGTVKVWNFPKGELCRIFGGADSRINPAAVNDAEDRLAAGCENGKIFIWDMESGRIAEELNGHDGAVRSLIFLKGGRELVSASYDGTLRRWEIGNGGAKCKILAADFPEWLGAAAADREEKRLAYTLNDGRVRIVDLGTGKEMALLSRMENQLQTLVFSGDGRYLAAGGTGGGVYLWRTEDWSFYKKEDMGQDMPGHNVGWLAFSPDSARLLGGGGMAGLMIWSVPELQAISHDHSSGQNIHCVQFSRNGKWAVSSGDGGMIDIWDIPEWKLRKRIRNPRQYEGMILKDVTGLDGTQLRTLESLGAVTKEESHVSWK